MKDSIVYILFSMQLIPIAVYAFLTMRGSKISKLRLSLIEECGDYNLKYIRQIDKMINLKNIQTEEQLRTYIEENDAFKFIYDRLPSYGRMVWSFKKVRLESWIDIETVIKFRTI